MNRTYRLVAITSLLLLCCVFVSAQLPVKLTLSKAIELSKKYSLNAKIAQFRYLGQWWAYRSFKAELLPSLSFGGSLMNYNRSTEQARNSEDGRINYVENNQLSNNLHLSFTQQLPTTGGTLSVESYLYRLDQFTYNETTYSNQPFRVTYTQPLRSFNALKWRKKTEPLAYEKSKRDYLDAMEEISIETTALFFGVLSSQSAYKQSLDVEMERQRLYEQTQKRFELGTVSKSELLQLELSLLNARVATKQHKLALENARFQLFAFMQAENNDQVELLRPAYADNMILSEADVYEKALCNSPHQLKQRLSIIESERALVEAKSKHGVQVSLFSELGVYKTGHTLNNAFSKLHDNEIVGLNVSVPIFDWGVSKGRVKTAKANLEVTRASIEQEDLSFKQNIHRIVQEFNDKSHLCLDAQRAEDIACERYDLTLRRFQAGAITVTELNTALQELELARSQSISQLQSFWINYYNIQKTTLYDYINHKDLTINFSAIEE